MKEWDKIKLEYESFDLADKSEILWFNEQFNRISLGKDIAWSKLSDNERQIKRIIWSKMAKKTEGYNKGFFRYEESIIDLYEALVNTLNKLNHSQKKDLQIIRLKALLYLIKWNINLFRDVRKMEDSYILRLKSLIYDCLNSSLEKYFIEEINILYLESKLEILIRSQSCSL